MREFAQIVQIAASRPTIWWGQKMKEQARQQWCLPSVQVLETTEQWHQHRIKKNQNLCTHGRTIRSTLSSRWTLCIVQTRCFEKNQNEAMSPLIWEPTICPAATGTMKPARTMQRTPVVCTATRTTAACQNQRVCTAAASVILESRRKARPPTRAA